MEIELLTILAKSGNMGKQSIPRNSSLGRMRERERTGKRRKRSKGLILIVEGMMQSGAKVLD